MSTKNTWESLADAGGQQVFERLHSADVVDALAARVAKGRQRRGVLQAGATVAAVGAVGIGAFGLVPGAADNFLQPSSGGLDIHVDDSVEFVGRRNDNTWGPHWFACGDVWEAPAEAGVTVPSEDAAIPQLRHAVAKRTAVDKWEKVFSGDTISYQNYPAVLSYVSWPTAADEPDVWSSETLGALVDGDGMVVGIAFEQPRGFADPVGPSPLEGEMVVQADMDLYMCQGTAIVNAEGEETLSEFGRLDGAYTLHTVTQVYAVPQPDLGEGYEVLATFVDYGRTEPFEIIIGPAYVPDAESP